MKERVLRDKAFAKKKIGKGLLSQLVKRNKATKWIAQYFKVSPRTISRRIKEYGLKGLRSPGRKPRARKVPKVRELRGWVLTRKYIDNLDKQYRFLNFQSPPTRYVNTNTLTCSDRKRNPKGKFTTCTVYYIGLESAMYFLYPMQYRYSEEGTTYNEIYHYFSNEAMTMLQQSLTRTDIIVIDLVAFHFTFKTDKIKPVKAHVSAKDWAEKLNRVLGLPRGTLQEGGEFHE